MNRRTFLFAAPAAAAGCRRTPAPTPDPTIALAPFRVAAGATFTTPKPPVDVATTFPQLKMFAKMTARLHPRYGDEPGRDETKIGGTFAWPAGEARTGSGTPFDAVIQVRAEDAPPQFRFRPGTDLCQVFWGPPAPVGGERPVVVLWRKRADLTSELVPPPGALPVPCRVHPERLLEYPPWATVNATPAREAVDAWSPPGGGPGPVHYARNLAFAPGSKLGGYAPDGPGCKVCGWATDFLLGVNAEEWLVSSADRWRPVEVPDDDDGRRKPLGLPSGGRVYVCRRCPDWPAVTAGA